MSVYRGDHTKGEIEILEEREIFRNQYATLNNDKVRFPSGTTGEYLRFRWNAPYGVMVFARDAEGSLLLIRNFRHENRAWHWEIPKGFGEQSLAPLACAQRELKEETGYTAQGWRLFRTFQHAEHNTYLYECTVKTQSQIAAEQSEAIAGCRLFSKRDCKDLLLDDRQVTDPTTLFLMAYLQLAEV